jgi:hypothetical protein
MCENDDANENACAGAGAGAVDRWPASAIKDCSSVDGRIRGLDDDDDDDDDSYAFINEDSSSQNATGRYMSRSRAYSRETSRYMTGAFDDDEEDDDDDTAADDDADDDRDGDDGDNDADDVALSNEADVARSNDAVVGPNPSSAAANADADVDADAATRSLRKAASMSRHAGARKYISRLRCASPCTR